MTIMTGSTVALSVWTRLRIVAATPEAAAMTPDQAAAPLVDAAATTTLQASPVSPATAEATLRAATLVAATVSARVATVAPANGAAVVVNSTTVEASSSSNSSSNRPRVVTMEGNKIPAEQVEVSGEGHFDIDAGQENPGFSRF